MSSFYNKASFPPKGGANELVLERLINASPNATKIVPFQPRILEIDELEASRQKLERFSKTLEKATATLPGLKIGTIYEEKNWFRGRDLSAISNKAELTQKMYEMENYLKHFVSGLHGCWLDVGNIKTDEAILRSRDIKNNLELLKEVPDHVRARIVCHDLATVQNVRSTFLHNLGYETSFPDFPVPKMSYARVVNYFNFFKQPSRYGSHFRSILISVALDESFCYEVQVLTENTYIKSLLDHPFLVSKTASFPDEESKNWLLRWVWKSNIADVIEHLEQTVQTTISAVN